MKTKYFKNIFLYFHQFLLVLVENLLNIILQLLVDVCVPELMHCIYDCITHISIVQDQRTKCVT